MSYINILNAVIIIIATFFIAKIIVYLLKKIGELTSKTTTELDDIIIKEITLPIQTFVIMIGVYFATAYLIPTLSIGTMDVRKIFFIIFATLAAYTLSKVLSNIISWYQKEISLKTKTDLDDTFLPIIKKIINIIIYGLTIVMILDKMEVNISPILASLGVAGLAVGLALQDTLSNFFSAIYITIDRPVKPGDYVEIEKEVKGYITEIGWRSTKIRTLSGNHIIFPNSKLSKSVITNFEGPNPEISVKIMIGVAYNSDLEKVEKITFDVAKKVLCDNAGGITEYEPLIRFSELNESSIDFKVFLRAKTYVDQFKLKHDFIKELTKKYREENIEIPFPQRSIHMYKEDKN